MNLSKSKSQSNGADSFYLLDHNCITLYMLGMLIGTLCAGIYIATTLLIYNHYYFIYKIIILYQLAAVDFGIKIANYFELLR